jgi:hypothetical protein
MEIKLSGALGRRTKFQDKAVAQLVVDVSTKADDGSLDPVEMQRLRQAAAPPVAYPPRLVDLNDDTLLAEMKLVDEPTGVTGDLLPHVQALVLALCQNVENINPRHG